MKFSLEELSPGLPAARSDLAATINQLRYTGWINLTGQRSPMRGVGRQDTFA